MLKEINIYFRNKVEMYVRVYSPLRYPGGKGFLYKFVSNIIDYNNLKNYCYVEPYSGGAGLALSLLFNDKTKKIILNDIDPAIYALWFSILNYPDELCRMIEETPININIYKHIQQNFNNTTEILQLGFYTLFLNRTNRSGIIKGGPIGGYLQNGKYKLDCRFNKSKIINLIKNIAELRDKIELYNLDATIFLREILKKEEKIFTFLDPPYFSKGNELYMNFYNTEDHANLAQFVLTHMKELPWIMTYDYTNEILELYEKSIPYMFINVVYTAGTVKRKQEILFYNKIVVPS